MFIFCETLSVGWLFLFFDVICFYKTTVLFLGNIIYTVTMTSRKTLAEDEICSLLGREDNNDGDVPLQSHSEIEDHLSEENVQSDIEDKYVDNETIGSRIQQSTK